MSTEAKLRIRAKGLARFGRTLMSALHPLHQIGKRPMFDNVVLMLIITCCLLFGTWSPLAERGDTETVSMLVVGDMKVQRLR